MSSTGSPAAREEALEVLEHLRLGTGFSASERDRILEQFIPLGARLKSMKRDSLDMELSVKERGGADQHVTLELWAAGHTRLVATSGRDDLDAALQEARDDMVRQVNDRVTRRERTHNQHR